MTRIEVWLSEHPFPTYDDEPFLAPMRRFAADFSQAHPEVDVVVTGYDYREMPARVAEAVRTGSGPHLAEYYAGTEQSARDTFTPQGRPYFTPVERAVAGRSQVLGQKVWLNELQPAVRAFFTAGGELQSVPPTVTTPLMFVNRTLLSRAGITEVPRTWAQLRTAAEAVAALPDGPPHAVTWPVHGWLLQHAVAQQGGRLAHPDNGRTGRAGTVDLASAEMLAWAQWWRELHADGHFAPAEHWGTAFELFAKQQVAFTTSTSKLVHDFVWAAEQGGFEVEVAPTPYHESVGRAGLLISGHSLWLADGLDPATRDAAVAFTQFLISPDNAATWHRATGFAPVTRSGAQKLETDGWFDKHPYDRVVTQLLADPGPLPTVTGALLGDMGGIQDDLVAAMTDVLRHDAEPRKRFTAATESAQRRLDRHNADATADSPRTPSQLAVH